MRAASLLQKVARFDGSAGGARWASPLGRRKALARSASPAGDFVPGNFADYVVLDATDIDPWSPPLQALIYRGQDAWVQAAFTGGRRVFAGEPSRLARSARESTTRIAERLVD